jgi:hypothetical protein
VPYSTFEKTVLRTRGENALWQGQCLYYRAPTSAPFALHIWHSAGSTACLNLLIIYVLSFPEQDREVYKLIDSCFYGTGTVLLGLFAWRHSTHRRARARAGYVFLCATMELGICILVWRRRTMNCCNVNYISIGMFIVVTKMIKHCVVESWNTQCLL